MACHLDGGLAPASSAGEKGPLVSVIAWVYMYDEDSTFLDGSTEELVLLLGPCASVAGLDDVFVRIHGAGITV